MPYTPAQAPLGPLRFRPNTAGPPPKNATIDPRHISPPAGVQLRSRPPSAPAQTTINQKLRKINIVVEHPQLPGGRSRVGVYPNRFRSLEELFELLSAELKKDDGSPLVAVLDTHVLKVRNESSGKLTVLEDVAQVADQGTLVLQERSEGPLGGIAATLEDDQALLDSTVRSLQSRIENLRPLEDDDGTKLSTTQSDRATHSWGSEAPPLIAGTFRLRQNSALSEIGFPHGRPSIGSAATPVSVSQRHPQSQLGGASLDGRALGEIAPAAPVDDAVVHSLLTYHSKVVTFLSTRLAIGSEIVNKELVAAEREYATAADQLVGELRHLEPIRAMRVLTHLAVQHGRGERGYQEEGQLTVLRDQLYEAQARNKRLLLDLDVCQQEIRKLRGKLDELTTDAEHKRQAAQEELESLKQTNYRLARELGHQRNWEMPKEDSPLMGKAESPKRGPIYRPSTAPAAKQVAASRHSVAEEKGTFPTFSPRGSFAETTNGLSATNLSHPSNASTNQVEMTRTHATLDRSTRSNNATPPRGTPPPKLFPAERQHFLSNALRLSVQFVTVSGEAHSKSIIIPAEAIYAATHAGLTSLMEREFVSVLRSIETAKGTPKKQILAITIAGVTLRTVKDYRLVELATDDECVAYLMGVAEGTSVALLCLEISSLSQKNSFSTQQPASLRSSPPGSNKPASGPPDITVTGQDSTLNDSPFSSPQHASEDRLAILDASVKRKSVAASRAAAGGGGEGSLRRHSSVLGGTFRPLLPATATQPKPTPMFTAESVDQAARDASVFRVTFNKLAETELEGSIANSSSLNDRQKERQGLGQPGAIRREKVLRYLHEHFDEMGDEGLFERTIDKCLDVVPSSRKAFAAGPTANARGPLRSGFPAFQSADDWVSFDHFCLIMLEVAKS